MRNTLKAATLESKFPLLAVESDCIVSKDADITVAFEVELPELFTVTSAEYAAIHAAWCKAIKVLPDYTVVHKQDWFVKERYHSRTEGGKLGFLSRSYELHFNERPFLNHRCYLYLTKTTKERMRMQSSFSSLCRGFIIPKEVNRDTAARFLDAAGQFARIVNDTGLVRLRRLPGDEVTGTEEKSGLLEKYLCLSLEDTGTLEDIGLGDDGVRIGDNWTRCRAGSVRTAAMNGSPQTGRTAASPSPARWGCCSRATTCTTSTSSSTTARRTCNASRRRHATCSRSPVTRGATKSTRNG